MNLKQLRFPGLQIPLGQHQGVSMERQLYGLLIYLRIRLRSKNSATTIRFLALYGILTINTQLLCILITMSSYGNAIPGINPLQSHLPVRFPLTMLRFPLSEMTAKSIGHLITDMCFSLVSTIRSYHLSALWTDKRISKSVRHSWARFLRLIV